MPNGRQTHTVVDHDGRPIPEVDSFLNVYMYAVGDSSSSIRAYSNHLALLFRWLDIRGASWTGLDFDGLSMFAGDLRDGTLPALRRVGVYRPNAPRARSTCEAVLAAVFSFLSHWQLEGKGPTGLRLYRDAPNHRAKHSFLGHVEANLTRQRRIKVRGAKPAPFKIIDFEDDFERLVRHANTVRDRLLVSALYDGGLRISQAIGLHHEDVLIAEKRVRVRRRTTNVNGALSKQRAEFEVSLPPRFFSYYGASLVEEQLAMGIDSDYVFVNLRERDRGRPMLYNNAYEVIRSIGARAGVTLTPHTLRHTHGTSLAKAGWSAPEIAERLGQSSSASADPYIHLSSDDIAEKYAKSSFSEREQA